MLNIAPYDDDRLYNRSKIEEYGNYVEIYIKTDIKNCEKRDVKGLYKLVREGKIKEFTGISDPFEEPTSSDIIIDGSDDRSILENINIIIEYLNNNNLI